MKYKVFMKSYILDLKEDIGNFFKKITKIAFHKDLKTVSVFMDKRVGRFILQLVYYFRVEHNQQLTKFRRID